MIRKRKRLASSCLRACADRKGVIAFCRISNSCCNAHILSFSPCIWSACAVTFPCVCSRTWIPSVRIVMFVLPRYLCLCCRVTYVPLLDLHNSHAGKHKRTASNGAHYSNANPQKESRRGTSKKPFVPPPVLDPTVCATFLSLPAPFSTARVQLEAHLCNFGPPVSFAHALSLESLNSCVNPGIATSISVFRRLEHRYLPCRPREAVRAGVLHFGQLSSSSPAQRLYHTQGHEAFSWKYLRHAGHHVQCKWCPARDTLLLTSLRSRTLIW